MAKEFPQPDLGELAQRTDESSRQVFLSAYADLTKGRDQHLKKLESRYTEIRAALAARDDAKELLGNLDKAYESIVVEVKRHHGTPNAEGVAAFASPAHDYVESFPLAAPIPNSLVLDSGLYLRPLARWQDEYESFILVLLDGERAAVYLVDEGVANLADRTRMDLIGRHKKGGWSQMRYQRHRQERVKKLLDEVVDAVAGIVRDGDAKRIIVAGPGQVKKALVDRFPEPLRDMILAIEDVDFETDGSDHGALVDRFIDLSRKEEAKDSDEAVEGLKTELLRGEMAVTGAYRTVRAARNGRVALLLIQKDITVGGRKCEEHDTYFANDAVCSCGSNGSQVDLVNEAVEEAARAESRIEFVRADHPFLKEVGGMAALLRW